MSYIGDLGSYMKVNGMASGVATTKSNDIGLDMTGFLTMMLAQFQNQSIDDTADTSEMLNQLVQMQMVQALVNMTDASVMSYAASLVGKEVTIGTYDAKGKLQETVGTVTATGTYGGEQVIFLGDQCFKMSQILAVGRLPSNEEKPDAPSEGEGNETEPPTDPAENV